MLEEGEDWGRGLRERIEGGEEDSGKERIGRTEDRRGSGMERGEAVRRGDNY